MIALKKLPIQESLGTQEEWEGGEGVEKDTNTMYSCTRKYK